VIIQIRGGLVASDLCPKMRIRV